MASTPVIFCPKCNHTSGDDWSQCRGQCPMRGSPHFDLITAKAHNMPENAPRAPLTGCMQGPMDPAVADAIERTAQLLAGARPLPDTTACEVCLSPPGDCQCKPQKTDADERRGPSILNCVPGARVVLLYEKAADDGTWTAVAPPRYGTVRRGPYQGVYGLIFDIEWEGDDIHSRGSVTQVLAEAWWGCPSNDSSPNTRTGFAIADDEANLRLRVRAMILDALRAAHKRLEKQVDDSAAHLQNLSDALDKARGARRCSSCACMYFPDAAERARIPDTHTTFHVCGACPPF